MISRSLGISLDVDDGLGPPIIDDRFRHFHVIGQTQSGKSSLLLNLLQDDMEDSVIVLDPVGSFADPVASLAPPERLIYVDKFHPICINPLQWNYLSKSERAQELTDIINQSVKAYAPKQVEISVQMTEVIREAVKVIPDDELNIKTLGEFLVSGTIRNKYNLTSYWKNFDKLSEPKASAQRVKARLALLYDDDVFCSFSVGKNQFDVKNLVDEKKIVVFNLRQFTDHAMTYLGASVSYAIKSYYRHIAEERGPKLYFYVDETHLFLDSSFKRMLYEAGKFHISCNFSNHTLSQMLPETADATTGMCHSKAIFICGDKDRQRMAKEIGVDPEKIRTLGNYECLLAVGKDVHHILTYPPPKTEPYQPQPMFNFLREAWIPV